MSTRVRKSVVDFILYSHLFISVCAVSLALLSSLLFLGYLVWHHSLWFIFSSTLGLYALHRLIGLQKVHGHLGESRFLHIKPFAWLLVIIIIVSLPISIILFLQFERDLQLFLVVPIALSLAYVLPIWKNRRLRDVSFIKIFIISLVWAMVTVGIPMWNHFPGMDALMIILMFSERFMFILAITLPFDIRDLEVDRWLKVHTIPMKLGIQRTKKLSHILLSICALFITVIGIHFGFSILTLLGYFIGLLVTGFMIAKVSPNSTDYFFSGWLDGTMIIVLFTTWIGHFLAMSLF